MVAMISLFQGARVVVDVIVTCGKSEEGDGEEDEGCNRAKPDRTSWHEKGCSGRIT